MATERVDYDVKVFDNFIEIIPRKGMKDNSTYQIKLNGIKTIRGESLADKSIVKFTTSMNPMYCSVLDVSSLLDVVELPEEIVLYNIREASKYADYIFETAFKGKRLDRNNIPLKVKEFTRHKSAKECLLRIYLSLITDNVIEGNLGDVKFKLRDKLPDIKKIIEYLDQEIAKWLDAIRGYDLDGRAKMQTAVKGYHHGGRNPMTGLESKTTPKGVPLGMNRGAY